MSRCMMPSDLPRAIRRHRTTRSAGRMKDATTAVTLSQGAGAVSGKERGQYPGGNGEESPP